MSTHPIQWQAPEPLWSRFGTTPETAVNEPDQFRPAILRFATDDFMEQMLATLARDPAHIGSLLARPETWRTSRVAEEKDMVERVVVPRIVQAVARRFALARPKSVLQPVESPDPVEQPKLKLKLYQPAHQRFYLVSASLVCRVAGLPDKSVVPGGSEEMGFVLRRMLPLSPGSKIQKDKCEFAFVKDAKGYRWQQIVAEGEVAARMKTGEKLKPIFAQMAAGEELLPLFPLGYRDALDHRRILWTGLIPVGRREVYMGTAVNRTLAPSRAEAQMESLKPSAVSVPESGIIARMTQFKMEVAEPWKNLIRASYIASESLKQESPAGMPDSEEPVEAKTDRVYTLNLQWQMQSWLILLDFADFLAVHLPEVWMALPNGASFSDTSSSPRGKLYDWLNNAVMQPSLKDALRRPDKKPDKPKDYEQRSSADSLRAALAKIGAARKGLETTLKLYGDTTTSESDWPEFHFLLAGLDTGFEPAGPYQPLPSLDPAALKDVDPAPSIDPVASTNGVPTPSTAAKPAYLVGNAAAENLDILTALIVRALEKKPEIDAPELPFAQQLSKAMEQTQGDEGWFVIRYVHIKRDCGPLQPPTLSEPTQEFQLAGFFDYDAPARPIRITLPLDTTPAGIRKHGKNTAFIISDVLCGQIQRAKGLGFGDLVRSVLPWPFHKDLELGDGRACDVGMICSLSIPIITICALILVTIIVSLLDLIFHWLPYFIICFPVKGLKAKQEENQ